MQSVLSDAHYHLEEAAYAYVEERIWPEGPVCHCGNFDRKRIGRLTGKTTRIGLYKCYACRQPFNVKIGTVFEKSHVPMRVMASRRFTLCRASQEGYQHPLQLQRTFNCGMKTAWFPWAIAFAEAMTVLHIEERHGPAWRR